MSVCFAGTGKYSRRGSMDAASALPREGENLYRSVH